MRVLWLGYLAPPNAMPLVGSRPVAETRLPTELLRCTACSLVQLRWVAAPEEIFPPGYPYRSGVTKSLREHFQKFAWSFTRPPSFVVDIGSNDGTLLKSFQQHGSRVWGIEPTDAGREANVNGIPTDVSYFDDASVERVLQIGFPDLVTATNVFAHIPDPNAVVERIVRMLAPEGAFISENHYWGSIVEGLQYDTVYHEHLRHYTVTSLQPLLGRHGLEVFHAEHIPTHGGSIRVYAARRGQVQPRPSVGEFTRREAKFDDRGLQERVEASRKALYVALDDIDGLWGIGAPSRAATLVQFTGLPLTAIAEVPSSPKIGRYLPGTLIPVVDEQRLLEEQPEHAIVLSWHIASEITANLRKKGYKGHFLIPLPRPYWM